VTDYLKKILKRQETREGAGTFTLDCGHQIAVSGRDWKLPLLDRFYQKPSFVCPECRRNAEHEAAK
jgi:hypothetical protein